MYIVTIIMCLCHVTLLNLDSSMELDSRLVKIYRDSFFVKSLQSLNGIYILVLWKPDIRIGVIIEL